jgi:hypothetical protein
MLESHPGSAEDCAAESDDAGAAGVAGGEKSPTIAVMRELAAKNDGEAKMWRSMLSSQLSERDLTADVDPDNPWLSPSDLDVEALVPIVAGVTTVGDLRKALLESDEARGPLGLEFWCAHEPARLEEGGCAGSEDAGGESKKSPTPNATRCDTPTTCGAAGSPGTPTSDWFALQNGPATLSDEQLVMQRGVSNGQLLGTGTFSCGEGRGGLATSCRTSRVHCRRRWMGAALRTALRLQEEGCGIFKPLKDDPVFRGRTRRGEF